MEVTEEDRKLMFELCATFPYDEEDDDAINASQDLIRQIQTRFHRNHYDPREHMDAIGRFETRKS